MHLKVWAKEGIAFMHFNNCTLWKSGIQ